MLSKTAAGPQLRAVSNLASPPLLNMVTLLARPARLPGTLYKDIANFHHADQHQLQEWHGNSRNEICEWRCSSLM